VAEQTRQTSVSKAMKAYLARAQEHDAFITKEHQEYQIGRHHLANMMGFDPQTMTDKDVDEAIKYLFPSGLFEPKARPFMRDPDVVSPIFNSTFRVICFEREN
jgi:small subunit ribosomal protein S9